MARSRMGQQKVDPQLMMEVLERVGQLPSDRRDFVGHTIQVVHVLRDAGYEGDEHVDLAMSVSTRLRALAKLVSEGGGRGWRMPSSENSDLLHEELVTCAAEAPFVEKDGDFSFDADQFHRQLLYIAEVRGSA